jgi:cell division protein FtsB
MTPKTTAPADSFSEAAAAHAKVRATIDALRAEYDATEAEIDSTAAELDRQLSLRLPPDEMKRAVVEILKANAQRFENTLRAAICDFILHKQGGQTIPAAAIGKPMTYADIESIIAGEYGNYEYTNLLKANKTPHVFDAPLFLYFGEAIAARIERVMDGIGPADMGYGKIGEGDIGCGLAERRALIVKLQTRLNELHARRADLAAKLAALGYQVPYKPQRQG